MTNSSRKLTLKDIGDLAGVSRATVSRVINGYPHITAEVRERVESVIEQTGYRPNRIAQSLASQKSGIIGLVIPHVANTVFTNPYFFHLINSITKATNQNDLTLALFLFHSMDEEEHIIKTIYNNSIVDGVIITADRHEDPVIEQVMKHDVRVVFIGKPKQGINAPFVNVDNENGGYLATEHLIKQGRKRIAAIICKDNSAGEDRFAGYLRALKKYQMPFNPLLIAEGDFSQESGYHAMKILCEHRPDAVFVSSDLMALGAQRAIRETGLTIPQDIMMVGYDDLPEAVMAVPTLTTIHQPIDMLGMIAVKLLKKVIDQSEVSPESEILPVRLVQRET